MQHSVDLFSYNFGIIGKDIDLLHLERGLEEEGGDVGENFLGFLSADIVEDFKVVGVFFGGFI